MEEERFFDLGTLLSITDGRLFTTMGNIHEIFSYLCQREVTTFELPELKDGVRSYILNTYPELLGVGEGVDLKNREETLAYLEELKKVYGDSFPLKPMSHERMIK